MSILISFFKLFGLLVFSVGTCDANRLWFIWLCFHCGLYPFVVPSLNFFSWAPAHFASMDRVKIDYTAFLYAVNETFHCYSILTNSCFAFIQKITRESVYCYEIINMLPKDHSLRNVFGINLWNPLHNFHSRWKLPFWWVCQTLAAQPLHHHPTQCCQCSIFALSRCWLM